jgi:chromosome segregation ATPase
MCKWVKKLMVVALIVIGVTLVVRNTWVGSHVRLMWQQFWQEAEESVPPERELERIRMELDSLKSEDDKLVHQLAVQERAVEKLQVKIADLKKALAKQEASLKELHLALESTNDNIVLHGETFTRAQVEKELKADFIAFEKAEDYLNSQQAHLVELKKDVEVLRNQRRELSISRQEMATELQRLETDLKKERMAEAKEGERGDDGHKKVKTDIEKLKDRVEGLRLARQEKGKPDDSPIKAARERHEQDEALKARMKKRLGGPAEKIVKGD